MLNEQKTKLKEVIKKEALHTRKPGSTLAQHRPHDTMPWIFDFRNIFLESEYIDLIAEIFWELHKDEYPFQVGGQEVSSIPLITAIVVKGAGRNTPVNGFFIRKSRKKEGLGKIVEGKLTEEKIVLVDDLINSGKTFERQVLLLESMGKKVSEIFTLLHYRDFSVYDFFKEKEILVYSLFSISDFGLKYNQRNLKPIPNNFNVKWYFKSENPNHFYVLSKSTPVLDDEKIYFGSDIGYFWALNQKDGSVAWKYKVGWHTRGKSIFSAPALYGDTVYFGAYDGNVYALDTKTGKKKWIFMEADWIGSSPAVAPELQSIFVGLEFGLFKKQGGIASLDLKTGKKKWEYIMPEFTHASPLYIPPQNIVVTGCNDAVVRAFDAKKGVLLWECTVGEEVKASCAYDEKRNYVLFGAHDGMLYIVDLATGKVVYAYETKECIYSTPLIYNDRVYFSSLDKHLYCLDLKTHKLIWKFQTGGRVFSSPVAIEGSIYIGANDGRLYELDSETGKELSMFQATERITNKLIYNEKTKDFFLMTFANEVLCLEKAIQTKSI